MGISRERKREHRRSLVGETRSRQPDFIDYSKIRHLKQRLPKGQTTLA